MLTCMLAHFFLWHMKIRMEKKHRLLRCLSVNFAQDIILPMKKVTLQALINKILWGQAKNHRASPITQANPFATVW